MPAKAFYFLRRSAIAVSLPTLAALNARRNSRFARALTLQQNECRTAKAHRQHSLKRPQNIKDRGTVPIPK